MRNTDPSRETVQLIRDRDGGCVVCGTHWSPTTQHRVARGMGGTRHPGINLPSNLIVLCGSGTTGCHGWVEAHPVASREAGWALRSTDKPRDFPVLYPDGWFYLDDSGVRIPDPLTHERDLELFRPRGHAGGGAGGVGGAGDDPAVAAPWPPDAAGSAATPDDVRPWGSAARR